MDIGVRSSCGAVAGPERTVETGGIDESPGSRLLKEYTRGAKGLLQEEKTEELMTATQVFVAEQIELQHRRRQALSCFCARMRARSFVDFLRLCASDHVYAAGVYLCLFMAVPVPTSALMFMPMSERLTQPLDTNGSNS